MVEPSEIDTSQGGLSSVRAQTTFCVAADANGNVLTYKGISWLSPESIDPMDVFIDN